MRRLAAVATSVVWSTALLAQPPNLHLTMGARPDGEVTSTIQNLGASTLTAYFFHASEPTRPGGADRGVEVRYVDAAFGADPVPPGQQHEDRFPAGSQVTLLAAIWADGNTYGDAAQVQRVRDHRQAFGRRLDIVLGIVKTALDSGVGPQALAAQLQTLLDGITQTTEHSDDTGVARMYYKTMIDRLTNRPPHHLDGSPLSYRETLEVSIRLMEERRERFRMYN